MNDIMKGLYVMTAVLLMVLASPVGTPLSSVSAEEKSVGSPLSSILPEEEPDGILFVLHGGGITREPAAETLVQIAIVHTCERDDELILEKVEICGETGVCVKSIEVNRTLSSILEKSKRLDELLKQLVGMTELAEYAGIHQKVDELAEEIRAESFSTGYFTVDLREIEQPLTYGDIPIVAKATLIHRGEASVVERILPVDYEPGLTSSTREGQITSSLLELQNWRAGVQHVHTEHSDWDASYFPWTPWAIAPTVREQAQAAAAEDLSWIIITDHEETYPGHGLSSEEWIEERNECAQAEAEVGIQVMCGEEVGACIPVLSCPRGHYLAYDIDYFVTWGCYTTAQLMISSINDYNGGFGFIAHPGGPWPCAWDNWNVSAYAGLEIMNGSTASAWTINKWAEILENPSARVFAVGNSDAHFTEEVANAYVYCDIGGAVTHSSVCSALENGRSVVSNGPLIAFTIGNKRIGDTLITSAQNAFLDIAWDAQDPEEAIQKIEAYSNEGLIKTKTYASGPATGTTTLMVNVTPQTLYVRLKGTFSNGEAYTNPIWIVYSSSGGGGCPFLQVWDGSDYVNEGLLDIHNAEEVDVTYEHTLMTVPGLVDGAYGIRLIEYPTTISDIDQVQLRAVLQDGTIEELPLQTAWHSEDGNVRILLRRSDDRRAEEIGADYNGGTSQSIDLEFGALDPGTNVVTFIFAIEGYNPFYKI
jgi:hypothetical protein